jgi:hypothetical protein
VIRDEIRGKYFVSVTITAEENPQILIESSVHVINRVADKDLCR